MCWLSVNIILWHKGMELAKCHDVHRPLSPGMQKCKQRGSHYRSFPILSLESASNRNRILPPNSCCFKMDLYLSAES